MILSDISLNSERCGIVLLCAGGTGGHFFPAIALGEKLIEYGYEVHLITDYRCKKYLAHELKIITHIIDIKIDTSSILKKICSIFKLLNAIIRNFFLINKISPSVMVGFGGYPTIPTLICSIIKSIPIVLHEQNSVLGKTNLIFSKFAKIIALSYPDTRHKSKISDDKLVFTGNIIRKAIKSLHLCQDFNRKEFRIFIIGGSQGAKIFARLIPQAIKFVIENNHKIKLHITQQVSLEEQNRLSLFYNELGINYTLSEFFHDIDARYLNTDLLISRAGAMTIAEISSIGLPTIFIPYPHSSDNHQFLNAEFIVNKNAGWCFSQTETTPDEIGKKIIELVTNPQLLTIASKNLTKISNKGDEILADTVIDIIERYK